jgi:hypothetical protein
MRTATTSEKHTTEEWIMKETAAIMRARKRANTATTGQEQFTCIHISTVQRSDYCNFLQKE